MPSTCNPSTTRLQDFCSTSSVVVKEESPIWTVWWIRVDIDTWLSSIPMFATDLNFFKLHIDYSGVSEQKKPLQPVGQAAEFRYESTFEHHLASRNSDKVIPEDNRILVFGFKK